jgi:hypothetical protein
MSTHAHRSQHPPALHPTATPSAAPLEPFGLEASWEQSRAEAARIDARDVVPFKRNPVVVLHNVRTGVAAVLAERAWFEAQPDSPRVDFARVADAETAAEALVFAATRAGSIIRSAPGVRAKIVRARKALRTLRGGAEGHVAAGVFAAEELPSLGGRGPLATAQACVAYASLFRAKQAQTRHVTRSYAYVERVAAWRWGRECKAIVPTLLARDVSRFAGDDEALDDELDAESDATTP